MKAHSVRPVYRFTTKSIHTDLPLLGLLVMLIIFGMLVLYSASNQNMSMVFRQSMRLAFAMGMMMIFAMIPPHKYKVWTPWIYGIGLGLLIAVMLMGKIGKGAQRWLDLGLFRFQPSEIMKLAIPMMTAWYFDSKSQSVNFKSLIIAGMIIFFPALLIAKQPDLGTAIMVAAAGLSVIFLAGISMKILLMLVVMIAGAAPLLWHFMHDYQNSASLLCLIQSRIRWVLAITLFNQKLPLVLVVLLAKGGLKAVNPILIFYQNMRLTLSLQSVAKNLVLSVVVF
ncbi:Rod shape-determining protein RodA [Legionella clemsonensis]|uniref:Rod shape-determining protein RodA n=1 Tax=Legionella clemsonensis TaxID=1867846 RepID=A0A222P1T2_9GAMM|nr:Rod shape-determining protein RodA [Legionella clemsonensis]